MGCFKSANGKEENQSRKPSNSPFKQQKLKAWQPVLTASTVLPIFFFIGVTFVPIGIGLLVTSNNVKEVVIEYSERSECQKCKNLENEMETQMKLGLPISKPCECNITFQLGSKWEGDIYFYYGLSNFYQNHRRYVRSRDDDQLHGTLSQNVNSNCEPFNKGKNPHTNKTEAIVPCGAIANSMFNDEFEVYKGKTINTKTNSKVPMTQKNIAWKSDRETKFRNPASGTFKGYLKPKYWTSEFYNRIINISDHSHNDDYQKGLTNQDFIVWMRVAAFPTFRKLYRKFNPAANNNFKTGLLNGYYTLRVKYNYPVKTFGGKKRFIMTTSSWIGGKNSFLGTAYIVIGCLCLLFGFIFLVIHMKRSKKNVPISMG